MGLGVELCLLLLIVTLGLYQTISNDGFGDGLFHVNRLGMEWVLGDKSVRF
jgi:hypothetical protein